MTPQLAVLRVGSGGSQQGANESPGYKVYVESLNGHAKHLTHECGHYCFGLLCVQLSTSIEPIIGILQSLYLLLFRTNSTRPLSTGIQSINVSHLMDPGIFYLEFQGEFYQLDLRSFYQSSVSSELNQ